MSDTDQPGQPERHFDMTDPADVLVLTNTCIHCSKTLDEHGTTGLCLAAGYSGNWFAARLDATVTVSLGDLPPVTIALNGAELSEGTNGHRYLTNASRDHIATEVEKALIALLDA